jgi:hypothetical protein
VSDAANQFSDDPEMFNAIFDTEAGKSAEINGILQQKAIMLVEQLQALQLINGKTDSVVKTLSASIRGR